MNIWKAELKLYLSNREGNMELTFEYELINEDYEESEYNNEYVHRDGWITKSIPKEMTFQNMHTYGIVKVTQGFNRELDEEELNQLKEDMKDFMTKNLEYEKEQYLKMHDDKLKTILEN